MYHSFSTVSSSAVLSRVWGDNTETSRLRASREEMHAGLSRGWWRAGIHVPDTVLCLGCLDELLLYSLAWICILVLRGSWHMNLTSVPSFSVHSLSRLWNAPANVSLTRVCMGKSTHRPHGQEYTFRPHTCVRTYACLLPSVLWNHSFRCFWPYLLILLGSLGNSQAARLLIPQQPPYTVLTEPFISLGIRLRTRVGVISKFLLRCHNAKRVV